MSAEEELREEEVEREAGTAGSSTASAASVEPEDERRRILRLLVEGKITAEEAEELLRALEAEPPAGAAAGIPGGPFGPSGPFGPHGPFGSGGPFGPHGPFGSGSAVAIAGQRGAMAPDVLLRWDRPHVPPPPPPSPPAPPVAPPPPFSAPAPAPASAPRHPARAAERSLEFSVKDGDRELRATLPMALAGSAERFLPRSIQQYLKRFEVDLATLLELAQATADEAIILDGPTGTGRLQLFHAGDEHTKLIVTLTRPWPR